ncbi:hypothetical protein DLC15_22795 [Salmonella enterica subsp. enterica serovar Telelkebir]|nr:hypothetical protein [Salmonella enterica subsp. enterica serovar Telelkebir]
MKLAFAKDIDFVKTGNSQKSPQFHEDRIREKFKNSGLIFSGFVLPYGSSKETYFRLTNPETGDYHDYLVCTVKKVNGKELFKTEKAVELRLRKKCEESGFELIALNWNGEIAGSTFDYQCKTHNELMTTTVKHGLEYEFMCSECNKDKRLCSFNGVESIEELRIKREKKFDKLSKGTPFKFVRWITGQKAAVETHAEFNCKHHGNWKTNCSQPLLRNSLLCPECLTVMRSATTGMTRVEKIKEMNLPVWLYVQELKQDGKPKFIKFGITHYKPEYRMNAQQKRSIYEHSMIFTHKFNDGWKAIDVELGIHKNFTGKKAKREDVPDGYTETRQYKHLPDVLEFIKDYIVADYADPVYLVDEYDFWASIGSDPIPEDELEAALNALESF